MKKGLKTKLLSIAKEQGYISFEEVERVCHTEYYRMSTALTMLRTCCRENKGIQPVLKREMNGKYIVGFTWIGKDIETETRNAFADARAKIIPNNQPSMF